MRRWNYKTWNKDRQKVLITKADFERELQELEDLKFIKKKRKVKRKKI